MCTVVLSFEPAARTPLLLLGVRDELTDRPWLPPARHWPGTPPIGGIDKQAGGTWLAVQPELPRVSCLLNGRGILADAAHRRSRGELPLRAAADGACTLKELAGDPEALAAYDPFHLVCADPWSVLMLSWDGEHAAVRELGAGTHMLTNAGDAYPGDPVTGTEGRALRAEVRSFFPLGEWLALAAGDGLDPGDPRAIIAGLACRTAGSGGVPR